MIYKYLLEIKYRILFSIVAWSFLTVTCYCFKETILYLFMTFSSRINYVDPIYFLTTDIAEVFLAYIQLSCYIAKQITVTFVYFQIITFLSTGLYIFEYIYVQNVAINMFFAWLFCVFTLNSYIFPISWDFFLKFQKYISSQSLTFHFEVKLNEYLVFYKSTYYICNLVFQTVILFFVFLDLFKTSLFIVKKLRKILYFSFLLFSTFLTPPEIIYQLVISVCIIVIYELVIFYTVLRIELVNF